MGNSFRFIFHLNLTFAQFFRGFVCKSVYLTIDVIHKPLIDDDSNNALYKQCKVRDLFKCKNKGPTLCFIFQCFIFTKPNEF